MSSAHFPTKQTKAGKRLPCSSKIEIIILLDNKYCIFITLKERAARKTHEYSCYLKQAYFIVEGCCSKRNLGQIFLTVEALNFVRLILMKIQCLSIRKPN